MIWGFDATAKATMFLYYILFLLFQIFVKRHWLFLRIELFHLYFKINIISTPYALVPHLWPLSYLFSLLYYLFKRHFIIFSKFLKPLLFHIFPQNFTFAKFRTVQGAHIRWDSLSAMIIFWVSAGNWIFGDRWCWVMALNDLEGVFVNLRIVHMHVLDRGARPRVYFSGTSLIRHIEWLIMYYNFN